MSFLNSNKKISFFLMLFVMMIANSMAAFADKSAAIMMYHRFGESEFPSTNITMEQFEGHIQELKTGKYTILALPELVDKLKNGEELPVNTVSITIDDGYLSIFEKAYPIFKREKIPFSVFISTDSIDRGYSGHMTWDQVKTLSKDPLVYIGAHTASHLHMAAASQARMGDEMARSLQRFEEELGYRPDLFAYPFGEASLNAVSVARGFGMKAAFSQHSGATGIKDDLYYLPRYALNEEYGDIDRFKMIANTRSLLVEDFHPENMTIEERNPPLIGFNVNEEVGSLERLACFTSHEGKVRVENLYDRRIEIRMKTPLPVGRTRLNCTLPIGNGEWRWFGRQFYVAP